MDERLLRHYERELQFLREAGHEFALEYPKIASHMGMTDEDVSDPSVERLLEGVAFLTARIQLQLESTFSRFSESVLAQIQPEILMPTPSFAIAQLSVEPGESVLNEGYTIPVGFALHEPAIRKDNAVGCEFRTLMPVSLLPIEISNVSYQMTQAAETDTQRGERDAVAAQIRIELRTLSGQPFCTLPLDEVNFYIRDGVNAVALYEALIVHACGIFVRTGEETTDSVYLDASAIVASGLLDDSVLEHQEADFELVRRFGTFPEGYRFVRIDGLRPVVEKCQSDRLVFNIPLRSTLPSLEMGLNASMLALFCVPIVNLFPKRCDRVIVENYAHEYAIHVDRTRIQSYELHRVLSVQAYAANGRRRGVLIPLYSPLLLQNKTHAGEYSLRRARRRHEHSYPVSDLFMSLSELRCSDIRQLGVTGLCSNGASPLNIVPGKGETDLVPAESVPLRAIRLLKRPSPPLPAPEQGEKALRAINLLSRSFLPLAGEDGETGAKALQELLTLYLPPGDRISRRWVEGICSLRGKHIVRRSPGAGPVVFTQGLRLDLELDERAYEGVGVVLFGAMLEAFFSRYVALNSFTVLRLMSRQRGVLKQWPARSGQCLIL